jgi:hypothetical protein
MSNPLSKIQPNSFDLPESAVGVAELFPGAWTAMERLISPNLEERLTGFGQLMELNAHRVSPLIAYVLVTRLDDPDINLRAKVVGALGGLLYKGGGSNPLTPPAVKQSLRFYLSQMRRRKVYALLQVAQHFPQYQSDVAAMLRGCSNSGKVLVDIFSDRRLSVDIRRQAIKFSGIVGFLEAVPGLERLAERMEARTNGRRSIPFAPPVDPEEKSLLHVVQTTLALLKAP